MAREGSLLGSNTVKTAFKMGKVIYTEQEAVLPRTRNSNNSKLHITIYPKLKNYHLPLSFRRHHCNTELDSVWEANRGENHNSHKIDHS